ncbi:MAG TPA: DNA-directed RNA polymerase subunit beta' [Actinomycetota bacterium]|nr:DNA-directed RNA polymerase subunit beta' [Actinomycetota bacterium]
MLDVNYFDEIRIGLATADQIRAWSNGEVKKPETINYRTLKPEKDGLFCERIFGPTRDWECHCGKYKRVRFKGIICERCGVEITRSKVRRDRMGHIELAAPVTHIWYFKGVPSRLGYLLDIAPKDLERIIYFAAYVITRVDSDRRHKDLPEIENEIDEEKREVDAERDDEIKRRLGELEDRLRELEGEGAKGAQLSAARREAQRDVDRITEQAKRETDHLDEVLSAFKGLTVKQLVADDAVYRSLRERFGDYFDGGMGAESIKRLLQDLKLEEEADNLRDQIATGKGTRRLKAIKRLKVVSNFTEGRNSPMGMVLDAVPVIPPDLRPMVQLDGGRFATSDLNDLYRRVINRNNRLKRLLDLQAPEIIVNNEKRMLQEAVDALFDNGRRGRPVTGPGNRPLKSLSDMLKGKQGRFRQNLLGKRVDYSGRSVIVVGPELRLHQCGLPKQMALELFKPFVMKRLVDQGLAQNIKSAKRMVERARPTVWDVLEEVIKEHPVLLNRAPTLHRLGIQAFEPVLVEGKAIQIHPLVCTAFNADFDGDQMAVHVPLSAEAQAEARVLMLSTNNILSPAHGRPIAVPNQDIVLGLYYLTIEPEPVEDEKTIPAFASADEALMALDHRRIRLHDQIRIRLPGKVMPAELMPETVDVEQNGRAPIITTTVGRVILNQAFPDTEEYVNRPLLKGDIAKLVDLSVHRYDRNQVEQILDNLKNLGFHYATRAGVTLGVEDVTTPPDKAKILDYYETQASRIESQYRKGIITDDERRQELIEIWTAATDKVKDSMEAQFGKTNPIYMMANSGARGNIMQIRQIAGMRGLVANPKGEIIPRPIKSNFREGLSVLEYFISTHGARKGLADTALRTADSGYLTRRLVDVAQELIVREEDCGTDRSVPVTVTYETPRGTREPNAHLETSLFGRVLAEDVRVERRKIASRGDEVDDALGDRLVEAGVSVVRVRSAAMCEAEVGVCRLCYGWSLATGRLVDIGESVGIVAAQSIGEPGTQLTMRTFHTGGVAGEDITHGLPRVVELFEARRPKGEAWITEIPGRVSVEDDEEKKERRITVTSEDGSDSVQYKVGFRARLLVADGDTVDVGQQLTEGSVNPHEKLRIEGVQALQHHLVEEVQQVYRSQGVTIHDKHIELIVRQMLRKVQIIEPGETDFLPGDLVDRRRFEAMNRETVENGAQPATARPQLLGITKASLATDSWLSAASFQETTRVLTEAAIGGRSDGLLGLKENVIIGKLIPAGTGMSRYRNIAPRVKPEAIPEYWLARQRELAEQAESGVSVAGEPVLTGGTMTREEAERMLGGGSYSTTEE